MRRSTLVLACFAALSIPAATAVAQPGSAVPGLTLSFLQPTGTGTPSSSFDIWLRLALDPNASPLDIDGSSPNTNFGMSGLVLPYNGYETNQQQGIFVFDTYSAGVTSLALECAGSFACGTPDWLFDFNYCVNACFLNSGTFSLAPGSVYDFHFGTFSPRNGTVPPGTYDVHNAHVTMAIFGQGHEEDGNGNTIVDQFGDPIVYDLYNWSSIANTCANGPQTPSCSFERTIVAEAVVATPEPATMSLVALGLIGIVGVRRRRRAA